MPSISYSLSSFTKTNTDMAAGTTFTASASGATVTGASITSGTLYLSSIRTYSGAGYLDFSLGSGTGSTGTFSSNSSTHSETVTLTGYSNALLTAGSGTVSFTLRRSSGSGNILNLRSGIRRNRIWGVYHVRHAVPEQYPHIHQCWVSRFFVGFGHWLDRYLFLQQFHALRNSYADRIQ